MARHFLGLSLFVMLLAFFIVLNAFSTFDETKVAPVLKSLTTEFTQNVVDPVRTSLFQVTSIKSSNEGSILDRVRNMFKARISGVDISTNRLGTIMRVSMSADEFEDQLLLPETPDIPFGGKLNQMLVSLLASDEMNAAYQMSMTYVLPEGPIDLKTNTPEILDEAVGRVSRWALILEEAGLRKHLYSAGISGGGEYRVDLVFSPYIPINPVEDGDG